LKEVQTSLDANLSAAQSENAELAARIHAQRQEIESLLAGLESVVSDIDGAAKASTSYRWIGK
jgi:kinetochore protein NNF1